ncbi:MAG: hypothetical protein JST83_03285 [Bacteroidetes bacterium]|nr:hypothetical protein [Bacteroidota bacterium]
MKTLLFVAAFLSFVVTVRAQTVYAMTYESVVTQSDLPILAKVGTTMDYQIKSNTDYADFKKSTRGKKPNAVGNEHFLLDVKDQVSVPLNDDKLFYTLRQYKNANKDSSKLLDGKRDETVNGFKCHLYTLDAEMTQYKIWIDMNRQINPAVADHILPFLLGAIYVQPTDLPGLIVKVEYAWRYEKKTMSGYMSLVSSDRNPLPASAIELPWKADTYKPALSCVKAVKGKDGKVTYVFAYNQYVATGTYKEEKAKTQEELEKFYALFKKVTGAVPVYFECSSF